MNKRLTSVLLWSVISAAFIGPGTLATATAAGSGFGLQLVWPLLFATGSCLLLQEMVARLSISTGKDLLTLINYYFKSKFWASAIGLSVVLGCTAYQAGNILGAVSGLKLIFNVSDAIIVLSIGVFCFAILWQGTVKSIVKVLGYLVATMGILFIYLALKTDFDSSISSVPAIPQGSSFLVLGLIGTTIVPYNLFLGSGVAKGESIRDMRFGLTISVLLGGAISIAILVVATNLKENSQFLDVAKYMGNEIGIWAYYFMGFGLFAAGITSSITAPMAAAIIAQSMPMRLNQSKKYRYTWLIVMLTGLCFGLMQVKPIPIIIAAQALNGFVLPAVVIVILLLVNHPDHLRIKYQNGPILNILSLVLINVILVLAINGLFKVVENFTDFNDQEPATRFAIFQIIALPFVIFTALKLKRLKELNLVQQ